MEINVDVNSGREWQKKRLLNEIESDTYEN